MAISYQLYTQCRPGSLDQHIFLGPNSRGRQDRVAVAPTVRAPRSVPDFPVAPAEKGMWSWWVTALKFWTRLIGD